MNKQDIIAFFDDAAPRWDEEMIKNDRIIGKILDGAGIGPAQRVLDVACGTGVLIPYYLQRKVAHVTAVDISPEMTKIARGKFPQANVEILCGDIESDSFAGFREAFDAVMVYNAFPHFPDPARLIATLAAMLKPGGTLTVAHGMSRAHIDAHHRGKASRISLGLMHADDLAALIKQHLPVTVKISDDTMYQITGRRPL